MGPLLDDERVAGCYRGQQAETRPVARNARHSGHDRMDTDARLLDETSAFRLVPFSCRRQLTGGVPMRRRGTELAPSLLVAWDRVHIVMKYEGGAMMNGRTVMTMVLVAFVLTVGTRHLAHGKETESPSKGHGSAIVA